jgi:hypothetical protein
MVFMERAGPSIIMPTGVEKEVEPDGGGAGSTRRDASKCRGRGGRYYELVEQVVWPGAYDCMTFM